MFSLTKPKPWASKLDLWGQLSFKPCGSPMEMEIVEKGERRNVCWTQEKSSLLMDWKSGFREMRVKDSLFWWYCTLRWGAREAGVWKKLMSSAVFIGLRDIQRKMSARQLDLPAYSSEVLAEARGLCVVDLLDPKTCAFNQKTYFTLFLSPFNCYSNFQWPGNI